MQALQLLMRTHADGVSFDVVVSPRASREAVLGVAENGLRVALTAPPVDNAANEALIRFVAKQLQVPRRAVTITGGEHSRKKVVHVTGVDAVAIGNWVRSFQF